MVERLQRSIQEMEGQWQGMTRERFYGDYQQARATMIKFVECLQSISTELKQISVKFRSTDEMVNGAAAGGAVAGAGILAGAATGTGIAATAATKTSGVSAKSSNNPLDAALEGVEVEGSVIKHEENGLYAKAITGSAGASLSEGAHASGAVVEAGYANDHVEGSVSLVKAEVEAAVKDGTLSVGAEATLNKYEGGVNIPLPWTDKELHIGGSASLGVLGASAEVGKSGLKFHVPLGPGASLVGVGGAITVK
jgi:WXG100 family type VII secretion target